MVATIYFGGFNIIFKFAVFLILKRIITGFCYRADSNEDGRITREEIKEVNLLLTHKLHLKE